MHITEIDRGMKVRDADGESIGKVIAVGNDSFVVEKGLFFPKDYTVPMAYVYEIRGGEVWLDQPRDALARATSEDIEDAEQASAAGAIPREHRERAHTRSQEEVRVPLAEEEVSVGKHSEQIGEVAVHKEVVTEEQQLTVPVTREEVHVERVPVSGESLRGERAEGAFEERSYSVPVHEEKVTVSKEPVVREEVRVEKTTRPEEKRIATQRRKEVAEVEETGEGADARPSRPGAGAERPSHP